MSSQFPSNGQTFPNPVTEEFRMDLRPTHRNDLRRVLNQAAHAAVKKKGSHFQVVFRRLLPRLGYQSAIWAVAHRLCRMVWKILHEGVRFIEQGVEPDPKAKNKRARTLARALRKLGYEVTITPINLALAENGMQI